MTDTISDLLIRICNARSAGRTSVYIPFSKMKESLIKVLKDEGYICDFKSDREARAIIVNLEGARRPFEKMKKVSKPGQRVYVKSQNIPRPKGGYGMVILSTPKGVISGRNARRIGIGGEVICEVW
jgi:small subunit ribosomal protein S8